MTAPTPTNDQIAKINSLRSSEDLDTFNKKTALITSGSNPPSPNITMTDADAAPSPEPTSGGDQEEAPKEKMTASGQKTNSKDLNDPIKCFLEMIRLLTQRSLQSGSDQPSNSENPEIQDPSNPFYDPETNVLTVPCGPHANLMIEYKDNSVDATLESPRGALTDAEKSILLIAGVSSGVEPESTALRLSVSGSPDTLTSNMKSTFQETAVSAGFPNKPILTIEDKPSESSSAAPEAPSNQVEVSNTPTLSA